MKLLRNPEIKRELIFLCLLSALFSGAAFFLSPEYGILTLFFCLVFVGTWVFTVWKRYQRLQDLGLEIDRILQNESHFDLSRFAEGELSILYSEIYKMTVRLREQTETLRKDKLYLADSLADISHQIRTPLTSLHLIADFLAEEELSGERRLLLVREFVLLLSRMDWLVATLLKLSRLDTGTVKMEKKTINLRKMTEKAAEPVAIPMDIKNQRLVLQVPEEAELLADAAWTQEAVGNILKNCMEHTPEGGTITVEGRQTPLFTEMTIFDDGSGIASEDLPHLFERFYKGKGAGKNSVGIGLALAQMIVTAQDGTIKAENRREGGAKFVLRFYMTTV